MALRDMLAAEVADHTNAAQAAAQGRSMTGFSGRHTEIAADREAIFGAPAQPIMGERVNRMEVQQVGPSGLEKLIENDPLFAGRRPAMRDRQPFGAQEQQLAVPDRPGYRRYWFSDLPGRIARAKKAGYAHVTDPDTGEAVSRITDKAEGRGRSSFLMEIPLEWYQDDMSRQAAELNQRLRDIREGNAGPGASDNRYVPKQGIKITGR